VSGGWKFWPDIGQSGPEMNSGRVSVNDYRHLRHYPGICVEGLNAKHLSEVIQSLDQDSNLEPSKYEVKLHYIEKFGPVSGILRFVKLFCQCIYQYLILLLQCLFSLN
jgi:hypothetical protein